MLLSILFSFVWKIKISSLAAGVKHYHQNKYLSGSFDI